MTHTGHFCVPCHFSATSEITFNDASAPSAAPFSKSPSILGRRQHRQNLARGRHAEKQLAARSKKFFGNQHCKGCANSAADNAAVQPILLEHI